MCDNDNTVDEIMSTRRTRLSALRSEETSHCNDGSGDEIVRCYCTVINSSVAVQEKSP